MDYMKNSYSKIYGISTSKPKFAKIYTSHTDVWANIYKVHLKLNFRKAEIYRDRKKNLIFWSKN